jgi:hypothetical protein
VRCSVRNATAAAHRPCKSRVSALRARRTAQAPFRRYERLAVPLAYSNFAVSELSASIANRQGVIEQPLAEPLAAL